MSTRHNLKKSTGYLFLVILGFAGFSSAETIIKATRTDLPPIIDGKLTDACWPKAMPITDFKLNNTSEPAKYQTIGYILYDDNNVYIGMKCLEPDTNNMTTREHAEKYDAPIFGDDCIEIMLDTTLDMTDYFHFAVNASGSKYDALRTQGGYIADPAWDGTWEARSFIGKDHWTCEVSIPFYTLGITPKAGPTWGLNLCREKKKPFENSAIAKEGAFNTAGSFTRLEGLDADLKQYCYEVEPISISTEIKDEKLHATVEAPVKNTTGKKQEVKIEGWLIGPDQKPHIKSDMLELKSGEQEDGKIGPFVLESQGAYDCYVTISELVSKQMLYFSRTRLNVSYVPMAITLIEPFYRDAIFTSQNLENVILKVTIKLPQKELEDKKLFVSINAGDKSELIVEKIISSPSITNTVEFPCNELPYGKLFISANLKDNNGKSVVNTGHPLQKLPYKKGEVWLGEDLNWYIDGADCKSPANATPRGLPLLKTSGFLRWWRAMFHLPAVLRTALQAGRDRISRDACNQLDGKKFFFNGAWGGEAELKYLSVPFTWRMSPLKPGQKEISDCIEITRSKRPLAEIEKRMREQVQSCRDNPDLFGYHLEDEPINNCTPVETIEALYKVMRDADPYHPVIITHNSIESGRSYVNGSDYISFHHYPAYHKSKRINDMSAIMFCADQFDKLGKANRKFIGYLVQGINAGDDGQPNQRIRSYDECRAATFMAMIGGAKGFIQYNRMTLHYPEIKIGAPYQVQELAYLGKSITAPDSKLIVKARAKEIRMRLKDVDGELYLFAVNVDMEPRQVQITIPGISKYSKELNVISEDRKITTEQDSFGDRFDPFEVHIYTTSQEKTGLTSVKEICKEIDAANAARRKPGNLAFQMREGDGGVEVRASSNRLSYNSALWHIADGIVDKISIYNAVIWCDNTPNEYPDWIEIKLPDRHPISRVVVYAGDSEAGGFGDTYTADASLKDYEVQAYVSNTWETVDAISGNKKEVITHTFNPVITDRIRLWITGANKANSRVTEIELYEK